MRARVVPAFAPLFILVGCAGKVVGPSQDDDAGARDAAVADVGAVEAGPDCVALKANVDALRAQAITCCPICHSQQCGNAVADVCCPISITATSAPDFEAAVASYKAQCAVACTGITCAAAPSLNCVPSNPQSPSAAGTCQ